MFKKYALLLMIGLLAGCAGQQSPQAQAQAAIAEAQALYAQSYEMAHPWRAAKRQIAAAETALAAGDLETAMVAAAEAKALAEASIEQARAEADSSARTFPFAQ